MNLEQVQTQTVERDLEAISRALRGARLARTALAGFPGLVPESLKAAYKIQTLSIGEWPDGVAGWKVGGVPGKFQSIYGAERLAGPIFSRQVARLPVSGIAQMPAFRHGFAAVEPEFIMEIGDVSQIDIENTSLEEIAELVNHCYTGVEVASSPVPDINSYGPAAIVSDFGNNNGLLLGQEITDWSHESLARISVSTTIDGVGVGECCCQSGFAGPLGAILFLIKQLRANDLQMPEGLLVSTGAITGVHEAEIGSRTIVEFAGQGSIELELIDLES